MYEKLQVTDIHSDATEFENVDYELKDGILTVGPREEPGAVRQDHHPIKPLMIYNWRNVISLDLDVDDDE